MFDSDDWDDLNAAHEAVKRVVPDIVQRHRSSGTLTWALLHRIEDEVAAELAATGEHQAVVLKMMRSVPAFGYPVDDRPASFANAGVVPVIFEQIEKAWRRVH